MHTHFEEEKLRIPLKIGLVLTGLFCLYEIYGFLTFEGFDRLLPPFLLIVVTPILIAYLAIVFAWYRSKKLFWIVVGPIFFLLTLAFVLEKIDYSQTVNASDLSKAIPLEIGKDVRYETRGLYPLYNSYKVTVPADGDYKISFNSDTQIGDFSPMSVYTGKPIEILEEPLAFYFSLENVISALHLYKFHRPGIYISFKNLIWERGHYDNGWAIVRNAKKGENYGVIIHRRELSVGGRASYYTLKVEPVQRNLIDVFNTIHGPTADLENTIERYTFIPHKDSNYAVVTVDNYWGNQEFPITIKKNNETVETKLEQDRRLKKFLVFRNVKAGEAYTLELDKSALIKAKMSSFQIWISLPATETWH